MFIPTPGYSFLAFDLSQAETWVVAYLANEWRMKDALTNSDIHTVTAAGIFHPLSNCNHPRWIKLLTGNRRCDLCSLEITEVERYLGKKSNHGNSYQQGPEKWTETINAESDQPPYVTVTVAEAKKYNKQWMELYPSIKNWWRNIEDELTRNNRTLRNPFGRTRTFFGRWGRELFKEATAYVPQSTVADLVLGHRLPRVEGSMDFYSDYGGILRIASDPAIMNYCSMVHTAYDSIMMEVPVNRENEFAPLIYKHMHRPLVVNDEEFTIPCDGEVGDRWGEMEPIPKAWLS